jgi:hypothetical protein
MKTIEIIQKLLAAQTYERVHDTISEAWEKDCEDFFLGLDLATNPAMNFGLAAVPEIDEEDDGDPGTLTFAYFYKVALNIASGELEASQVRKVLEDCALSSNITEWNLWYRRILLKSLASRLPMADIQKALISLTTGSPVLPNTEQ